MNKKRTASLITAIFLVMIFTLNCFAALGTADPDKPEEGISYADTINDGAVAKEQQIPDVIYEHGISAENAKIINSLINYWNNYGLLTITIVLAVIVTIAVVISFHEKKKLNKIRKHPDSEE